MLFSYTQMASGTLPNLAGTQRILTRMGGVADSLVRRTEHPKELSGDLMAQERRTRLSAAPKRLSNLPTRKRNLELSAIQLPLRSQLAQHFPESPFDRFYVDRPRRLGCDAA